jgi:hypothetical protein
MALPRPPLATETRFEASRDRFHAQHSDVAAIAASLGRKLGGIDSGDHLSLAITTE